MNKSSRDRTAKWIVAISFVLVFLLVNNNQNFLGALLYLIVAGFLLVLNSQWDKFGRISDLEGLDDHWMKNSFIGIVFGVGTIIVGQFVSFVGVIGIPPVQSIVGTVARFIIVVPTAAILEEIFFRDYLNDFFESKLGLNRYLAIFLTAIGFSIFHLTAYGGSLAAAGGSFLSAGLMGFVFGVVTETRNSLATSIFYHATLNAWIGFISLSIIV